MKWRKELFEKWGKLSKGKPEDMECADFVGRIRRAILEERFNGIFFHVPNEEIADQKPQTALIKKIIGKVPGAPDYAFISSDQAFVIEMKAGKGRQSPKQVLFQDWCNHAGVDYYLCFSADEAWQVLLERNIVLL